MPVPANYVPIAGSERLPLTGAQVVGAADPAEHIQVTVILRQKHLLRPAALVDHQGLPRKRKYLTLQEYEQTYSADNADIEQIRSFANANSLTVAEVNPIHRSVTLAGSVADFENAFGVTLQRYQYSGGGYRGRVGPIHIPKELDGSVQGVFGLDNRPAAVPHCSLLQATAPADIGSVAPSATPKLVPLVGSTLTVPQVAGLYSFPGGNGAGQTIGIIELGGGINTRDLTIFFKQLNLRQPQVTTVSVDGANSA